MKNLVEIDLVWGFESESSTISNFAMEINEVLLEFQVEIIGFIPMSASGAWPEFKFLGEEEQIKRLLFHYHQEDESEAMDYYEYNARPSQRSEVNVHVDTRWSGGERKFIEVGGKFM
jgi:hypothetical protein